MKYPFGSPLVARHQPQLVDEDGATAHLFIGRVTALVDELDMTAETVAPFSPATARHLRLFTQQLATFALTAIETWPQASR